MANETGQTPAPARRAKLRAIIAEQDRIRGRPLTDKEKVDNLFRWLNLPSPTPPRATEDR